MSVFDPLVLWEPSLSSDSPSPDTGGSQLLIKLNQIQGRMYKPSSVGIQVEKLKNKMQAAEPDIERCWESVHDELSNDQVSPSLADQRVTEPESAINDFKGDLEDVVKKGLHIPYPALPQISEVLGQDRLRLSNGSEMGSILPKDTEQMLAEELQLEFSLKNCEIWEKIQTPFNRVGPAFLFYPSCDEETLIHGSKPLFKITTMDDGTERIWSSTPSQPFYFGFELVA
ncbi:Muscarinic Acetylcholine Receptor M2 [Manis pentadactyla]|nr:Muscarinic Acetylcholine Receptor M2 [Manis pentadactyla]